MTQERKPIVQQFHSLTFAGRVAIRHPHHGAYLLPLILRHKVGNILCFLLSAKDKTKNEFLLPTSIACVAQCLI